MGMNHRKNHPTMQQAMPMGPQTRNKSNIIRYNLLGVLIWSYLRSVYETPCNGHSLWCRTVRLRLRLRACTAVFAVLALMIFAIIECSYVHIDLFLTRSL